MQAFTLKSHLSGSIKIGGHPSSLKTSSCNPWPRYKFYIGTDNPEDLYPFSKKPATSQMEKMVQAEAEMFTNLEMKRNQGEAVLADESRLRSNFRVTSGYLNKLDSATTNYKQAVTDLITSEEMDVTLKTFYTNKLNKQLKLTDPILSQLQNAVDFFNAINRAA